MAFSSLILGVLLILVIFNVGETVTKKLYLKKIYLIILLAISFISSFFNPFIIGNFSFSIAGFIIPLILSIYYLFKVGSVYSFLRVGVSTLLVTTLTLIYNSISYGDFEYNYLQPYMILALVLGLSVFFISKTPSNSYLSFFLGYSLSNTIHFLTKNLDYDYSFIELGGQQMLSMLLLSTVASLVGVYIYRKVKLMKKRRARVINEKKA